MKRHKILALTVLLLGIGVMVLSGAKLVETQQVIEESDRVYENLRSQVKVPTPVDDKAQQDGLPADTGRRQEDSDISFGILQTINSDAAAWLYCPNTMIDYPVMKADDYNYYLTHLPNGMENSNGSLFIDFNCASDFSDPLTVIYGHNMKSKKMFGTLTEYKNQEYFDEHPYMYLYTEQGSHRIDLMHGFVIGARKWKEWAAMQDESIPALIAYAETNTTFKSGINYEEGNRIIALSTCSYEFTDARYVVLGILRSK